MKSRIETFIVFLVFLPFNAFFFHNIANPLVNASNSLFGFFSERLIGERIGLVYPAAEVIALTLTFVFAASVVVIESIVLAAGDFKMPRLLAHLRFAPTIITMTAAAIVYAYDFGKIELSKADVRAYIYRSVDVSEPRFMLHNDYRGWCGNGYSESINRNYLPTALAGFDSDDAATRRRALLAADYLSNSLFNGADEDFDNVLIRACGDADASTRVTADELLRKNRRGDCVTGIRKR